MFGISWVPSDLPSYARTIAESEQSGFELIGVPDSQARAYRELYVAATLAVGATERARIVTMTTNAVTRHAAVTANALRSLDELSGGRIGLGIGTGDSALTTIDRRPATRRELAAYVDAVRAGLSDDGLFGRTSGGVPVLIAAEGPRTIRLAAEIGDGAVLAGDLHPDRIPWYREQLAAGGRNLADFPVWALLRVAVADKRADAMALAATAMAAAANHAYRAGYHDGITDPAVRAKLMDLRENYRPADHNDFGDGPNPNGEQVLADPDLAWELAGRFGIVGTVDDCAQRLRDLRAAGLENIVVRPVMRDPREFLAAWRRIRAAVASEVS